MTDVDPKYYNVADTNLYTEAVPFCLSLGIVPITDPLEAHVSPLGGHLITVDDPPVVVEGFIAFQSDTPSLVGAEYHLEWVTRAQTVAEAEGLLVERRLRTDVEKWQFCHAAYLANRITETENLEWSRGTALPQSVIDGLAAAYGTPATLVQKTNRTLADTMINRLDPHLTAITAQWAINDAQLDNLFAVAAALD